MRHEGLLRQSGERAEHLSLRPVLRLLLQQLQTATLVSNHVIVNFTLAEKLEQASKLGLQHFQVLFLLFLVLSQHLIHLTVEVDEGF